MAGRTTSQQSSRGTPSSSLTSFRKPLVEIVVLAASSSSPSSLPCQFAHSVARLYMAHGIDVRFRTDVECDGDNHARLQPSREEFVVLIGEDSPAEDLVETRGFGRSGKFVGMGPMSHLAQLLSAWSRRFGLNARYFVPSSTQLASQPLEEAVKVSVGVPAAGARCRRLRDACNEWLARLAPVRPFVLRRTRKQQPRGQSSPSQQGRSGDTGTVSAEQVAELTRLQTRAVRLHREIADALDRTPATAGKTVAYALPPGCRSAGRGVATPVLPGEEKDNAALQHHRDALRLEDGVDVATIAANAVEDRARVFLLAQQEVLHAAMERVRRHLRRRQDAVSDASLDDSSGATTAQIGLWDAYLRDRHRDTDEEGHGVSGDGGGNGSPWFTQGTKPILYEDEWNNWGPEPTSASVASAGPHTTHEATATVGTAVAASHAGGTSKGEPLNGNSEDLLDPFPGWECAACTFANKSSSDRCAMCGSHKSQVDQGAWESVSSRRRPKLPAESNPQPQRNDQDEGEYEDDDAAGSFAGTRKNDRKSRRRRRQRGREAPVHPLPQLQAAAESQLQEVSQKEKEQLEAAPSAPRAFHSSEPRPPYRDEHHRQAPDGWTSGGPMERDPRNPYFAHGPRPFFPMDQRHGTPQHMMPSWAPPAMAAMPYSGFLPWAMQQQQQQQQQQAAERAMRMAHGMPMGHMSHGVPMADSDTMSSLKPVGMNQSHGTPLGQWSASPSPEASRPYLQPTEAAPTPAPSEPELQANSTSAFPSLGAAETSTAGNATSTPSSLRQSKRKPKSKRRRQPAPQRRLELVAGAEEFGAGDVAAGDVAAGDVAAGDVAAGDVAVGPFASLGHMAPSSSRVDSRAGEAAFSMDTGAVRATSAEEGAAATNAGILSDAARDNGGAELDLLGGLGGMLWAGGDGNNRDNLKEDRGDSAAMDSSPFGLGLSHSLGGMMMGAESDPGQDFIRQFGSLGLGMSDPAGGQDDRFETAGQFGASGMWSSLEGATSRDL